MRVISCVVNLSLVLLFHSLSHLTGAYPSPRQSTTSLYSIEEDDYPKAISLEREDDMDSRSNNLILSRNDNEIFDDVKSMDELAQIELEDEGTTEKALDLMETIAEHLPVPLELELKDVGKINKIKKKLKGKKSKSSSRMNSMEPTLLWILLSISLLYSCTFK